MANDTTERMPRDYALEHAEYMAKKAERMMDAVSDLARAELEHEDGAANESDVQAARETVSEAQRSLGIGVHEFRKRRDRALTAPVATEQAQAVAEDDFINDASGTTWKGMRAVAWMWEAVIPMPGGATLRQFATHWSTGPKDAERLYRESDVRAMLAASPEAAPAAMEGTAVAWEYQNMHGNKFLTHTDPAGWHPHDREGFQNFRALDYAAVTPAAPSATPVWKPEPEESIDACLRNSLARAASLLRSTGHTGDGIDASRLEYARSVIIERAALAQPAPVQQDAPAPSMVGDAKGGA